MALTINEFGKATFDGHRYQFVPGDLTWLQAKAEAESLGGHLVTITRQEEDDWLRANVLKDLPEEKLAWIGGERLDKDLPWHWVTNEPFGYTRWRAGEGNDPGPSGIGYINDMNVGLIWADWINSKPPNAVKGPLLGTSRAAGFIVEWDTLDPSAVKSAKPIPSR